MASTTLYPKKTLTDPTNYWKLVLLSSFMMTSTIILGTQFGKDSRTENDDGVPIVSSFAYSLGGLLVGFGTRIGNGCTSGHGVCGLARLSPRSFIAVMTFMMAAIITVFLTSPTAPWAKSTEFLRTDNVSPIDSQLGMQITSLVVGAALIAPFMFKGAVNQSKLGPAALSGSLFASGLAVSQMVHGSKLFGFLNVGGIADGSWDPTLVTVLGSAVGISFISYQFTEHFSVVNHGNKLTCPLLEAGKFSVPTNKTIDTNLVAGSAIFGIGWALALVCPGPALFLAAIGHQGIIFQWLPAFFVGSMTAEKYKQA
jgi:uncharacterized membrane protein YedE/YeeE